MVLACGESDAREAVSLIPNAAAVGEVVADSGGGRVAVG